jgi:hypothetical protein
MVGRGRELRARVFGGLCFSLSIGCTKKMIHTTSAENTTFVRTCSFGTLRDSAESQLVSGSRLLPLDYHIQITLLSLPRISRLGPLCIPNRRPNNGSKPTKIFWVVRLPAFVQGRPVKPADTQQERCHRHRFFPSMAYVRIYRSDSS